VVTRKAYASRPLGARGFLFLVGLITGKCSCTQKRGLFFGQSGWYRGNLPFSSLCGSGSFLFFKGGLKMVIVMDLTAGPEQIKAVQQRLEQYGFEIHFIRGVKRLVIGAVGDRHEISSLVAATVGRVVGGGCM
jgi:hypothetical protein